MWDDGTRILGGNRPLLGKMIREHGQVAVIEAIHATKEQRPPDETAYFIGCLRRQRGNGERPFTIGIG
jgi:hypothetical protein